MRQLGSERIDKSLGAYIVAPSENSYSDTRWYKMGT